MRAPVWLMPMAVLAALAMASPAAADCGVQMTVTASAATEPGLERLYKYTLAGSWERGMSGPVRVEIGLPVSDCACACDPGILAFTSQAGVVVGQDQSAHLCEMEYSGAYICRRVPSSPPEAQMPSVEFDASASDCRVGTVGSGVWHFYSPFPPAEPATYQNLVVLRMSDSVCAAPVTGQMPLCRCVTAVLPATWGRMKAIYK